MRVIPILNLIPTLLSKWCYISHENKRKRNPKRARAMVMVFSATFNNISIILWRSVLNHKKP
jgi:hypothetical protein